MANDLSSDLVNRERERREREARAINALRKPDPAFSRVPNAVRQSLADEIQRLLKKVEELPGDAHPLRLQNQMLRGVGVQLVELLERFPAVRTSEQLGKAIDDIVSERDELAAQLEELRDTLQSPLELAEDCGQGWPLECEGSCGP